jgi:hypothetical protein
VRDVRRLLLATMCLWGCQGATATYEGRPCSEAEPCGSGTRCDLAKKVCVKDQPLDGPWLDDGPPRVDAPSYDGPPVADQSSCGTGLACASGQDCIGGKCACVAGGACAGCCQGDTCVVLAAQTTQGCGLKGQACTSCVDPNDCTTDSCVAGACSNKALPDGTTCATGTCKSGGCNGCTPACSGKQCGPDGCGGNCGTCSGATPTCNGAGQCVCTPACGGKNCGPNGCGGNCGTCGSTDYCQSGVCTACPTCATLGYYTGALRGCTFDGSNGCICPGADSNSNNACDSNESCWGWDNCSTGNHNPANCHSKKAISVPSGCTPPPYCFECT